MPIKTVVNWSTHMYCYHLILLYMKCLMVRNQSPSTLCITSNTHCNTETWGSYHSQGRMVPKPVLCPVYLGGFPELGRGREGKCWNMGHQCGMWLLSWLSNYYLPRDLFLNYLSSVASLSHFCFCHWTESFWHFLGTLESRLLYSSCLVCQCHWLCPLFLWPLGLLLSIYYGCCGSTNLLTPVSSLLMHSE